MGAEESENLMLSQVLNVCEVGSIVYVVDVGGIYVCDNVFLLIVCKAESVVYVVDIGGTYV